MKLTTVLTAVNENPKYTRFIPAFVAQWKRLYPHLKLRILWIGTSLPHEFEPYSEHIILFPTIPGISTVYTAQTIRILYPALLDPSDVTVITDMDMLPGNSDYFDTKLKELPESAFVSMRPLSVVGKGQIAICYNVASTETWKRLFGIHTEDDVRSFLLRNYRQDTDGVHGGRGWCQDQELLYRCVVRDPAFIQLDDSRYKRLDFVHHRYDKRLFHQLVTSGQYSDAHIYADACPWTERDIRDMFESST